MQLLQKLHDTTLHSSFSQDRPLVFYGLISGFKEEHCLPLLSSKEIVRSEGYLLDSDKSRYIISRALLKTLLATILQTDAKQLEFQYTRHGKPFLQSNTELSFSVSHTGDVFVIALSIGCDIGVDVERLDREAGLTKLKDSVFSPAELQHFLCMDPTQQKEAFISCWTKKEALLKATSEGLTKAMNTLDLSFMSQKEGSIMREDTCSGNKKEWFLESFTPLEPYTAAVAVKGPVTGIEYVFINASHAALNK